MNIPFVATVVVLLLQIYHVELLVVRRYFQDGILYEDYAADASNVRYSVTEGEGWNNLDTLIDEQGLHAKAMFCTRGPGSWLLYPEPDFHFGFLRKLKLVSGEYCAPADNVNSIQPLAPLNDNDQVGAIVHFSEAYFASKGEILRNGTISAAIKSAIFLGFANWTVSAGGKTFCLTVLGASGDVCLLEDLQSAFAITDNQVTITELCDETTKEIYHLQSCYSTGFHVITYEFDFELPQLKEVCKATSYDPTQQSQEKFLNVMKIWEKRLVETKDESPSDVPNILERMSVFTQMIKIMRQTCQTLNAEYMEILRNVFLLHIRFGKIWENATTSDGYPIEQDPRRWTHANMFISDCAENVLEPEKPGEALPASPIVNSEDGIVFGPECLPTDITAMKNEMEADTMEDFLLGEDFDFVIEQIWLLLNYVSPYCNNLIKFKNNYWSEFPLLFKRDFLYPIQAQWKDPGKWVSFYPIMFNGFDMEDERRMVISCVQKIILHTPFYDPVARPPDLFNETMKNATLVTGNGPAPGKIPGKRSAKFEEISLEEVEKLDIDATIRTEIPPLSNINLIEQSTTDKSPSTKEEGKRGKKKKGGKHSKKGKKHSKSSKKGEHSENEGKGGAVKEEKSEDKH